MTDYVSIDEYARRIVTLSALFPNYCHRFPILSWSYKYDYKELQKVSTNLGVPSRLYKGLYYNSYGEDDKDFGVETNFDNQIPYETSSSRNTLIYHSDIYETKPNVKIEVLPYRPLYPVQEAPDSFPKLQPGMTKLPLEQLRILFMLYPKEWSAIKFFEYQHGSPYPHVISY